jgi:hypothetical protein
MFFTLHYYLCSQYVKARLEIRVVFCIQIRDWSGFWHVAYYSSIFVVPSSWYDRYDTIVSKVLTGDSQNLSKLFRPDLDWSNPVDLQHKKIRLGGQTWWLNYFRPV